MLLIGRFCRFSFTRYSSFAGTSEMNRTLEDIKTLKSRLFYQSKKRGILENDLIIGGFAQRNLSELTCSELEAYDKIINGEHNEWDLYYFFVNRKEPPTSLKECAVFQKICLFARSKKQNENL